MRAHPDRIRFGFFLIVDPELDEFLGEHVAFEEELVVLLEFSESFFERTGHRWNLRGFFRFELENVLVKRFAGIDLVFDAIESRHKHGRKGEVRITRRVGRPEFEALGLRAFRVDRNADRGGAVAA